MQMTLDHYSMIEKKLVSSGESPFHLMGLGCVVFLQAALGMEARQTRTRTLENIDLIEFS